MSRIRIKVVGHSGYGGLLSTGMMIAKGLRAYGFHLSCDREYPSLIKGGTSCFKINAHPTKPIKGLSKDADILIAIDKPNLVEYLDTLVDGGTLIFGYEKLAGLQKKLDAAQARGIKFMHLPAREILEKAGGTSLMKNTILLGMTWKVLGLDLNSLHDLISAQFAKKPKIIPPNHECARLGYEGAEKLQPLKLPQNKPASMFIDGNYSLALGAIHAGVKAYYAYPMSPSSSILTHMANHAAEYDVVVKQAEDEITVANLALGSMYGGTRALCATSGGGFDLMTETVSLAGITEIPWVCVVVQRPGPGTGLPTWTAQGDLKLAINAGHGEFSRCVIAVSDPQSAFELIQHALNIAEKYQIPVIVLSDKLIAESMVTTERFKLNTIEIKRGLPNKTALTKLKNTDRYEITENGISTRWIPGSSDAYYFTNGDEHDEEGIIDESPRAGEMYAKRCRKNETLKVNLPEPLLFDTKEKSSIAFVGWGSTKNIMHDIIDIYAKKGITVHYLHFEYMWPLRTEKLEKFFKNNENIHLIEGNHDGQLGDIIAQETGRKFREKLLKWNGRPFFTEDLITYIDQNIHD